MSSFDSGPGYSGADSNAASQGTSQHSNLYVKNLPASFSEDTLLQYFSAYGRIESCRISKSRTGTSKRYGFVKFHETGQALSAIQGLNNRQVGPDCILEVKLADSDAGPPSASSTGNVPSNNLYLRNIPPVWGEQELLACFSQYGVVQECRVLHAGDLARGAGALVRMDTVDEAWRAITSLNGYTPPGASAALLVRFADSAEEKARKLAKKDRLPRVSPFQAGDRIPAFPTQGAGLPVTTFARISSLPPGWMEGSGALPDSLSPAVLSRMMEASGLQEQQHQQAMMQQLNQYPGMPSAHMQPDLPWQAGLPGPNALPPTANGNGVHLETSSVFSQPGSSTQHSAFSSLYIKNLPPDADKLYLYERFAPHGAILSVKVLVDEQTGKCKGVGFVNYSEARAARDAINALHGTKVGDKLMHVSLQTHRGARNSS